MDNINRLLIENQLSIEDTSNNYHYTFEVSELTANRRINLPVLSNDDTFVFTDHSQTLNNKTINTESNDITVSASDITSGTLTVSRGGTGRTTFTSDAVLKGNGSGGLISSGITIDENNNLNTLGNVTALAFYGDGSNLTGFTTGDMSVVQIRRTTTLECSDSYVNVTFDITEIENDASGIEHNSLNTDRIVVKDDGLYQVHCVLNFDELTTSEPYVRFYKNGLTVIGAEYSNSSGSTNSFPLFDITTYINLFANDYITVQIKDIGLQKASLRPNAIFSILRMSGAKGDPGTGEANLASNIGQGLGLFKQKNGVELEFRSINSASSKLSTTLNGDNIVLDIVPSNIEISDLNGYVANEHIDWTVDAGEKNINDANIISSSITQHQSLLSITESQISDLQTYALDSQVVHYSGVETINGNKTMTGTLISNTGNSVNNVEVRKSTSTTHWIINAGSSEFFDNWLLFKNSDEVEDYTFAISNNGAFRGKSGSSSSPTFTFSNASDYGMSYDSGPNEGLAFSTEGVERLKIKDDGTLSVVGTPNYETLVTSDDDIPNKKYVDDIVKSIRQGHTWGISGEIAVASGDDNYLIPFYVSLTTGQSAKIVSARYRINSGTSVTVKLQKNGVDVIGFTNISVTTVDATTDSSDVELSNNDKLGLVVTGVVGSPKNMTFTMFIEHTI
jgi:hypothetical protein